MHKKLPPCPEWLKLGARIRIVGQTRDRRERSIVGIKPTESSWEILPSRPEGATEPSRWWPLDEIEFVEPPPPYYRPWPFGAFPTRQPIAASPGFLL